MKKRVKRIVASGIILAGILANGVAVSAAPKAEEAENNKLPFTDVSETDWFYSAVEKIYDGKIMLGPEDNKFSPYEKLARAQLAVIVHRMEEEQAENGQQIFYDIYSDEEKQADPDKENTGLFFFRGKSGAKTAVTNAGGGFVYVAGIHDSFPHALELSKKGYNAFALIYRPGAQTACEDLARAIAFLYDHAEELEIDMDGYSLWGGSAGARMAAWLGSYGTESFGEKAYPRPGAVIMQYTGLSEVTGQEPPTYACVGTKDGIASYRSMASYINQIKADGTDAEIQVFEGLSHGFGLGQGTVAEGWIDEAVSFWKGQVD